jgi:RimJ/RimL family protein N-acetyltransferase
MHSARRALFCAPPKWPATRARDAAKLAVTMPNSNAPLEVTLRGQHVYLAPLRIEHVDALAAASAEAAAAHDTELYKWSPVPQSRDEVSTYVESALKGRDAGTMLPFTTHRASDNVVIGSTRYCYTDRWAWPPTHARYTNPYPDVVEIGYTWLARSAVRTAANTEAKLLMLAHAFDTWKCVGVCLHTDARNARSRAAIERIGGKFDGILRAHRMAADFIPRDSARYSITAAEWPTVRGRLQQKLAR